MTTITVVLGTARHGNYSGAIAHLIADMVRKEADVVVHEVCASEEVRTLYTLPPWGDGGTDAVPTHWQKIAEESDGFIFVLPEYNRGYPGEWKLLMDTLYSEYAGKVAGLVGVSNGMFGGARVIEHVKPVLVELGLVVLRGALHVPHVETALAEGAFVDSAQHERTGAFVHRVVAESARQRRVRYTTVI